MIHFIDFDNRYWKLDHNKFNLLLNVAKLHPFNVTQQLKKHHQDIIQWIDSVIPKSIVKLFPDINLLTKVYFILNNLTVFPECEHCKNPIARNVRGLKGGFPRFCSQSCSTSCSQTVEAHKRTCKEKHGDPNFTNREKAWKTTFDHFGVKHPQDDPAIRQKTKKTNIKKYGKSTYMASDDFKVKSKKTMISNYRAENIMQVKGMPDVAKKTKEDKYGDPNFNNREKYAQTMLKTYGVDHNFKSENHKKMMKDRQDELSQKKRQTLKKHFNREFTLAPKYKFNNIIFDSIPELAFFIWLLDHDVKFTYQPDVSFEFFDSNMKKHLYFPDFQIGDQMIEIKGDHFFRDNDPAKDMICPFDRSKDMLFEAKHQCMIKNNVQILTSGEYKKFIDYVKTTRGKDFFQKCKIQRKKQFL